MRKTNTAERLKELMRIRNLRQVDILKAAEPYCDAFHVRLNKNDLSQYVNGKVEPGQEKLYVLAQALKVSPAWLMGYNVSMEESENEGSASEGGKTVHGVRIPVLGTVAAGLPIEAVEDILDFEEIPQELANTGEFFALQLKGNSMEPRMCSGDVVIVRQQPDVESGEIAVVLVNGNEATVKKLIKKENGIMLQAFNPVYEPIFYSAQEIEELPVRVIGKVIELRGKF